jgi:hypothetical protein
MPGHAPDPGQSPGRPMRRFGLALLLDRHNEIEDMKKPLRQRIYERSLKK